MRANPSTHGSLRPATLRTALTGLMVATLAGVGIVTAPTASSITYAADMTLTVRTTGSTTVEMPLSGTISNIRINWGDGSAVTSPLNSPLGALPSHTYTADGDHTVRIYGTNLTGFGIGENPYQGAETITSVSTFASTLTSLSGAFFNAANLTTVPATLPASVTDLSFMFYNDFASKFNGDISGWNTRNVTTMLAMFYNGTGAGSFNQPLGNWDVSNVTTMNQMFRGNPFNKPLANWNTSNATNLLGMFWGTQFNQPIGNWNTSNVTNTSYMFRSTPFNQPIGNWDVSNVTNMYTMFYEATAFDQNLGGWSVLNVSDMEGLLNYTAMSADNYDSTLNGWAAQTVQSAVTLDTYPLVRSTASDAAFTTLTTAPNSWVISHNVYAVTPDVPSVSITGQAWVGSSVTAATTVSNQATSRPTLSYVWQSSLTGTGGWTAIPSATKASYTIPAVQRGRYLKVIVTASNGTGTATPAESSASAEVIAAPSAPRSPVAVAKIGSATVSWQRPATNGGNVVTSYKVTATPRVGRATRTCTTSGLSCPVSGLTNGVAYAFTVKAINAAGSGPASTKTAAVTPFAVACTHVARVWKGTFKPGTTATSFTLTSTGATKRTVMCTVTGTGSAKRVSCTIALNTGTSRMTISQRKGTKVIGTATRTQKV